MRAFSLSVYFFAFAALVRADLHVTAEVTQETTPGRLNAGEVKEQKPIVKTYTLEAVIGADAFSSATPDLITLADFKKRQLKYLYPAERKYTPTSLYTALAFRVAELPNRLMQAKALAAGGFKDNPFETVLMEHLFALRAPETKMLQPDANQGRISYTHDQKPLFSASSDGTQLTAEDAARFVRYLRYVFPVHPDILTELEKRRVLPKEFDVYRYDISNDHFHLVVKNVEAVDRAFDVNTAIKDYHASKDEVTELCALRTQLSAEEFSSRNKRLAESAVKDGEAGHLLDCALGALEYGLCEPEQQVEVLRRFKDSLQKDPDCAAVFGSLHAASKETAQKAAERFHKLEEKTKHPEMLKIFAANVLTGAGKPGESMELFHQALRLNPCITGAWKDLGDLYYMRYEVEHAWACWDTGRLFVPQHPQFRTVTEFEQQLVTEHPEFF